MRSRILRCCFPLVALAAFCAVAAPAAAKPLENAKRWSAHLLVEGKSRICYVHGEPATTRGKYKQRGPVFVQITHRPAEKVRDEVGFTAGYTHRKDSEVIIDIDGRRYSLFTERDTAWAREAKTDRALVRAMVQGRTMTVSGTSTRGTKTTDTYSLLGFTKVYRAAKKACRIK